MTGVYPHTQLFSIEMGSLKLFAHAWGQSFLSSIQYKYKKEFHHEGSCVTNLGSMSLIPSWVGREGTYSKQGLDVFNRKVSSFHFKIIMTSSYHITNYSYHLTKT
jgi:hypothetical protein